MPPVSYFIIIANSSGCLIEKHENYIKQTYRNRCTILGANGCHDLIVPVKRGSFHKTAIADLEIDNSLNWRQVHRKAIEAAYRNATYYQYYIDNILEIILSEKRYLIDLNMELLELLLKLTGLKSKPGFTDHFIPPAGEKSDYRYSITPKADSPYAKKTRSYFQVFSDRSEFVPDLSVIDLLFNTGPEAGSWLSGT